MQDDCFIYNIFMYPVHEYDLFMWKNTLIPKYNIVKPNRHTKIDIFSNVHLSVLTGSLETEFECPGDLWRLMNFWWLYLPTTKTKLDTIIFILTIYMIQFTRIFELQVVIIYRIAYVALTWRLFVNGVLISNMTSTYDFGTSLSIWPSHLIR